MDDSAANILRRMESQQTELIGAVKSLGAKQRHQPMAIEPEPRSNVDEFLEKTGAYVTLTEIEELPDVALDRFADIVEGMSGIIGPEALGGLLGTVSSAAAVMNQPLEDDGLYPNTAQDVLDLCTVGAHVKEIADETGSDVGKVEEVVSDVLTLIYKRMSPGTAVLAFNRKSIQALRHILSFLRRRGLALSLMSTGLAASTWWLGNTFGGQLFRDYNDMHVRAWRESGPLSVIPSELLLYSPDVTESTAFRLWLSTNLPPVLHMPAIVSTDFYQSAHHVLYKALPALANNGWISHLREIREGGRLFIRGRRVIFTSARDGMVRFKEFSSRLGQEWALGKTNDLMNTILTGVVRTLDLHTGPSGIATDIPTGYFLLFSAMAYFGGSDAVRLLLTHLARSSPIMGIALTTFQQTLTIESG